MAKANHDKILITAETILDQIRLTAQTYTTPKDLHELSQAFAAIVEASPNVSSGEGRSVTVRS